MNYSTSEVHIYPFVNVGETPAEDCLTYHNHRESECSWMIVDDLKLTIH